MEQDKLVRIRQLNDELRKNFLAHNGQVMLTSTVGMLADDVKARLFEAVKSFEAFDDGNDPHHEHDFGTVEVDGVKYFFKHDYYDIDMRFPSDDPSDPKITKRTMLILRADEY